jgi:RimJ/RimL family protein N-acetyltransferase
MDGLEGFDWGVWLSRPGGVPVLNDAHAAIIGEAWRGAARGRRHAVMLTLGTGVGGAAIVDGRLLRGASGRAGHLGHISLDPHGPVGILRTPGALEELVGECSLQVRTAGRFSTTRALLEAATSGDSAARDTWLTSVRALACALVSFVNVFDPDVIILGGGVTEAGDLLWEPLNRELDELEWRPGGQQVPIVRAELGGWAGAYGAAIGEVVPAWATARAEPSVLPVGAPVPGWSPRPRPPRTPIGGRYCAVEPLDIDRHAADLHEANLEAGDHARWTYLSAGGFDDFEEYRTWLRSIAGTDDPLFHAIVDASTGRAVGVAAYLRIDPDNGVIEVGHINYSPRLQRTRAATEAMYLMMRRAFDELGYRRYEWKCDSLNAASRAAAARLGFTFEGIFRQAIVYKGRNRDTAWFSIVDREWPALRAGFERWLDPTNFDGSGRQIRRLEECRQP